MVCTAYIHCLAAHFTETHSSATCVTKPAEPFSGGDTGFRTYVAWFWSNTFTPLTFYSILGNGTSSTVYLIHGNKAEKRFESSEDLLNERAIYRVLGSHPRLLSIYNIGPDYMVMEWMKNGDLAHFLRAHPEILPKYKHRWIMQIAESFGLLHTYQISHCDSKLENFLLDANYNIKICDFASSHNYRAPSKDLAIQPMRYRRAVDDFDEAVFNPADDIFAFGSICYEIITGGPPYPQLDDENVRLHFSQSDFPPTDGLSYGSIISDCWNGNCISFKAILSAIEQEIGQFEVCKIDDSNSDST